MREESLVVLRLLSRSVPSYNAGRVFDDFFFRRHLDDEENVRLIVHKHWMLGVKSLSFPTLALLLVLWIPVVVTHPSVPYVTLALCALCFLWWLRNFLDYYLDVWIITDEGIIDLEWHGWFHRESSRVLYSDVQGVSYEIQGVAGTLLRFGTISVEKISTGSTISLPFIPRPRVVETMILRCMEEYLHAKNLKDAKTVQTLLAEFVAGSMQMRDMDEDEEEESDDDA